MSFASQPARTIKCCNCNGRLGKCNNCSCVKSKTKCSSCAPGTHGNCNNNGNRLRSNSVSLSQPISDDNLEKDRSSFEYSVASSLLHRVSTCRTPVIKFIPKRLRTRLSIFFCKVLSDIMADPKKTDNWLRLFLFSFIVLKTPKRGGKHTECHRTIEKNLQYFESQSITNSNDVSSTEITTRPKKLSEEKLREMAINKVEDGKIGDAIRLLLQDSSLASATSDTINKLKEKHPTANSLYYNDSQSATPSLIVSSDEVQSALDSFPKGSSGGIDGLTPQHLKDMFLNIDETPEKTKHLAILTQFVNFVVSGGVPPFLRPLFFAARLIALNKKDGGIRPIAISHSLRRLTSKVVARAGAKQLPSNFKDAQFGIGVRSGCEIAVHHTRQFFEENNNSSIIKIDFKNAFNTVKRSEIIKRAEILFPDCMAYIRSSYASHSFLLFGNTVINSEVGVQQGDPLGPLLFCCTIQPIVERVQSKLNVWYMDDGTIGGEESVVVADFEMIKSEARKVGLEINMRKCEALNVNSPFLEDSIKLNNADFHLLGAPITKEATTQALSTKSIQLEKCLPHLKLLPRHHAFKILQVSFGTPNLMSVLRSSPCHEHPLLQKLERSLRRGVEDILNLSFTEDSWNLASLPVKLGGIGIRKPTTIALPAYLSSLSACIKVKPNLASYPTYSQSVELYKQITQKEMSTSRQKELDQNLCENTFASLLETSDTIAKSRLTSITHKFSGDWLKPLPVKSLGTTLSDSEFSQSVSLRLGIKQFVPHKCKCSQTVDALGSHCFVCSQNNGKILRHTMVNECLSNALQNAGIPNQREPTTVGSSFNIRPDGITLIPFKLGLSLAWDVSCPHPLCDSHKDGNTTPGATASKIEDKKRSKYKALTQSLLFEPIVIDTLGAYGKSTLSTISSICKLLVRKTGNKKAGSQFRQRLSLSIQKGNCKALSFSTST